MGDDLRFIAVVSLVCFIVRRTWQTKDTDNSSNEEELADLELEDESDEYLLAEEINKSDSLEPSKPTQYHQTTSYECINSSLGIDNSTILDTSFILIDKPQQLTSITTPHTRAMPYWRIHDDQFSVECVHLVHSMVCI
jgi:hypothetical protein